MPGKGSQGFSKVLESPAVVDDETVILSFVHTICAGNSLHKSMGLERLVQIKVSQAGHIETCQPHGTHEDNPKRMIGLLERGLHINPFAIARFKSFLHQTTVRLDIQIPFLELLDLPLLLTHYHSHAR